MAKLTRVTGKVFGGSAPLDEIGIFGSAKAGNPTNSQDVATIQSLPAYINGWGSAILTNRNFPPIEEVTGVLKTISYQNCYLLQEGIPEYDANTNYSNTSIVKNIDGQTLSFFISLKNDNLGNPLTDGTSWLKANLNSARNIGEIITSAIPLSDSGLHLLDGTLISGNGIYKDFVDYIASIYNSSLNYFCSEAEWQTSVSAYGSCGKFVYTAAAGANPATVRLPKISDILEGTTDEGALGNLVEAGLPNITGSISFQPVSTTNTSTSGVFSGSPHYQAGGFDSGPMYGNTGNITVNLDASRSSSAYGNSTTVQPQTIKVLCYIVVANSTKTDVEVDIDEIATDLNGKADTDLSNINASQSAKDAIIEWGLPDYSAGIVVQNANIPYVAPANGFIIARFAATSAATGGRSVTVNGSVVCIVEANQGTEFTVPVSAGDVLDIPVATSTALNGNFYPCKGDL